MNRAKREAVVKAAMAAYRYGFVPQALECPPLWKLIEACFCYDKKRKP